MTARRDEAIERLLHETRPSTGTPGECPDAETLGAFTEGTLGAAARRHLEGHIADCHRCQMVTASMVNVESTLGTWPDERPAKASWWRTHASGWMVPAAVGVTAGALWLAVVDERRPPLAPVSDGRTVSTDAPAAAAERPGDSQALRDMGALGNARVEDSKPATPPASQPGAASGKAEESLERTAPAAPAAEPVTVIQEGRREQEVASASAPARADSAGLRQSAAGNEADRAPAQAAERPGAASPLASAASERAMTAQRREASLFDVVSPDPRVRWRVVAGVAVQRSSDRGASWATQQTGAMTELTAGSAPSADVCWLVGRGGVVLRTTNAGRAWQRVTFPEPVDLTAVTASSARDATVSVADGRRFRTTDGAVTWAVVP